jgi:predicted RecB family nuclease
VLETFVSESDVRREGAASRAGSITQAAPAYGFAWRDEDPGGLQTQLWLDEVRTTDDHTTLDVLEQRILAYNEDDVAATTTLRDGLLRSPN